MSEKFNENDFPDLPVTTPLTEVALTLHEFYLSLQAAGFSDEQAMYLVGTVVEVQASGVGYEE